MPNRTAHHNASGIKKNWNAGCSSAPGPMTPSTPSSITIVHAITVDSSTNRRGVRATRERRNISTAGAAKITPVENATHQLCQTSAGASSEAASTCTTVTLAPIAPTTQADKTRTANAPQRGMLRPAARNRMTTTSVAPVVMTLELTATSGAIPTPTPTRAPTMSWAATKTA